MMGNNHLHKSWTLVLLLVGIMTLLSTQAYAQNPNESTQTSLAYKAKVKATAEQDAERAPFYRVAEFFLNAYLRRSNNVDVIDWIDSSPYVTKEFKEAHRKMLQDALAKDPEYGLGFDPVIDGQDSPETYRLVTADTVTNIVTLQGEIIKEFRVKAHVININGISHVNGCGAVNMPLPDKE